MRRIHRDRVDRKLRSVNQCIREAEERRARGEQVTEEQINQLKAEQREGVNHETLQADNKDYIENRNRKREQRKLPQKVLDAVGGEL